MSRIVRQHRIMDRSERPFYGTVTAKHLDDLSEEGWTVTSVHWGTDGVDSIIEAVLLHRLVAASGPVPKKSPDE